jgi:hypothetical protein
MRRALSLAAALVVAAVVIGNAQDRPARSVKRVKGRPVSVDALPRRAGAVPKGLPPEHAMARIESNALLLEKFELTTAPRQEVVEFDVDGEVAEETIVRLVTECQTTESLYEVGRVRAYIDGKQVAEDRLTELLAESKHVLVSKDGKKLDPFYAAVIKEGTIVLVIPGTTGPQPAYWPAPAGYAPGPYTAQ